MAAKPLSTAAQLVLERVSRVLEAHAGADARTIRARAGMSRERGDAALARLLADGFIERQWVNGDWSYRSAIAYRANNETPRTSFGGSHSVGQGGG